MMAKSQLTLICPTYNRDFYLLRSAAFWSRCDGVVVIYVDGSDSPCSSSFLKSSNIIYLHLPASVQERVRVALSLIETPYAALIGDDEFFIPSALRSCVSYLNAHSDYSACMGRAIGFYRKKQSIKFRSQYSLLEGAIHDSVDPLERLSSHFSSYVPSHSYAVTRTSVLRKALGTALNNRIDVFAIGELIHEFMILAQGKTRVLSNLYWLRSHEVPPIRNSGDISLDTTKPFVGWWLSGESSLVLERSTFCDELASATNGTIDTNEVSGIFSCYVKNSYRKQHSFLGRLRQFPLNRVKLIVPASLRVKLKSRVSGIRQAHALEQLRRQGVTIDEAGLAECISAIESSWQG